ncbi:hypothetical protein TNCV_3366381 [Trichonephila clavipes]|nr:hypothetical protein TNCV_3366381 [Trichonephila clavipes]
MDPNDICCSMECSHTVDEFLEDKDIHLMDWPLKSQDHNPTEHVWVGAGRAISRRIFPPRTLQKLKNTQYDSSL